MWKISLPLPQNLDIAQQNALSLLKTESEKSLTYFLVGKSKFLCLLRSMDFETKCRCDWMARSKALL